MIFRVRQITDTLVQNVSQYIESGILPQNVREVFNCSTNVKYPQFIGKLAKKYKWIYSHFGIFMERLFYNMQIDKENKKWKENIWELYLSTFTFFTPEDMTRHVRKEDILSCTNRFISIYYFVKKFHNKEILYHQEYSYEELYGHPDIVIKSGENAYEVYDIKTTSRFTGINMKDSSILQIFAYFALMRSSGMNVTKIGIILPLQRTSLVYDMKGLSYNSSSFLGLLLEHVKPRAYSMNEKMELSLFRPKIGYHTRKIGGSLYKTLLNFYSSDNYLMPCQIFMRGNRGGTVVLSDEDISHSLSFIFNHNIKYYTHAPYTINLCYPSGRNGKSDRWGINTLKNDLQLTSVSGGRGVVVHTGKGMGMTDEEAYEEMYKNIIDVIDSATETCPLLLETPCDKGTELCGTVESMVEFYQRFNEEQRKIFKLCIDTCHIFAANYLPFDYIQKLEKAVGIDCIELIHLNDAKYSRGSSCDGHKFVGEGCIGMKEMLKVIRWASVNNISMVHE